MNKGYIKFCIGSLLREYDEYLSNITHYRIKSMLCSSTHIEGTLRDDMRKSLIFKYGVVYNTRDIYTRDDYKEIDLVIALTIKSYLLDNHPLKLSVSSRLKYRGNLKIYG